MKAARQLPAHCRDELKPSPPAVRVRTQLGRSVENGRGEDVLRAERPRHGTTKSAVFLQNRGPPQPTPCVMSVYRVSFADPG